MMSIQQYILSVIFLVSFSLLQGQDLKLDAYLDDVKLEIMSAPTMQQDAESITFLSSFPIEASPLVSPIYLPKFARENPTGYTYLCRLELQIEKDLPLGLWLDVGDESTPGNPSNANANLRFRFTLK